jgi:hypothetical protein
MVADGAPSLGCNDYGLRWYTEQLNITRTGLFPNLINPQLRG